ncbi:hypothetical protein D0817_19270 [Flavobacterium cupreum]|uniref:Replication initiation factor domain-containing protein n=2 Tax=Flavobacterium TaxID=237 RepID=A0A4Y7U9H6_9FLAO|nr:MULTISPECIES: hypothetical protein [Flavobacterium]RUT68758.1 hypothetical protein D0817_19270 [Flavobacterium cupreum]TCN55499.1 hypothetical protein EV142_106188 [Flavobacterium circumlabens]TEB43093.1 hypothetical protein D0809_16800 [Flavobacterium circumlabens]
MITYKERHQTKTKFKINKLKTTLINIDYLIINLEGQPFGEFPENSKFRLKPYDYGTKIFEIRSDLYYEDLKIGIYTAKPRSAIISDNLAQLQIENNLFYTLTNDTLKCIINTFCDETQYIFKSVNRLDICLDKSDINNSYRNLYSNIVGGHYLISGRPKNMQSYFETYKGKSILNGFQIGKRTSDKIIRCYNKTLSLQLTEKPYINQYYSNNGLKNDNVWRFEYQLNSAFFRGLNEHSNADINVSQSMTWGIFDKANLYELLKIANKGFFELRENTGKSEVNKEKLITLFDFDYLQSQISKFNPIIKRLKKVTLSSTTIKKRLAKSLFREYYANNQDISYIVALNLLLEDMDMTTENPLLIWFQNKLHFYLHEFRTKEKIVNDFDSELFHEHQLLFL